MRARTGREALKTRRMRTYSHIVCTPKSTTRFKLPLGAFQIWALFPTVGITAGRFTSVYRTADPRAGRSALPVAGLRRTRLDHSDFLIGKIERNRQSRGIAVNELARCSGIDQRRMWHILRENRPFRGDELVRTTFVLSMSFADYVTPEMAAELEVVRLKLIEEYGLGPA